MTVPSVTVLLRDRAFCDVPGRSPMPRSRRCRQTVPSCVHASRDHPERHDPILSTRRSRRKPRSTPSALPVSDGPILAAASAGSSNRTPASSTSAAAGSRRPRHPRPPNGRARAPRAWSGSGSAPSASNAREAGREPSRLGSNTSPRAAPAPAKVADRRLRNLGGCSCMLCLDSSTAIAPAADAARRLGYPGAAKRRHRGGDHASSEARKPFSRTGLGGHLRTAASVAGRGRHVVPVDRHPSGPCSWSSATPALRTAPPAATRAARDLDAIDRGTRRFRPAPPRTTRPDKEAPGTAVCAPISGMKRASTSSSQYRVGAIRSSSCCWRPPLRPRARRAAARLSAPARWPPRRPRNGGPSPCNPLTPPKPAGRRKPQPRPPPPPPRAPARSVRGRKRALAPTRAGLSREPPLRPAAAGPAPLSPAAALPSALDPAPTRPLQPAHLHLRAQGPRAAAPGRPGPGSRVASRDATRTALGPTRDRRRGRARPGALTPSTLMRGAWRPRAVASLAVAAANDRDGRRSRRSATMIGAVVGDGRAAW